ncbi:hypothetical protein EJ04DRAFT_529804 [Polyplosphaeria fusca]|uniref:Zn(2)-C6 fungal-type domain-containing protein n=1 Tax=Polyplosphaeria fusca TaxID=682080 RepID=A0A9P4QGS3_9PLEO|nr:hypothetical protein EJ04DRAFT_529804 [Polyplosphaeria fusca]
MSTGSASRARLACSSCTRRKVKCSKTTPCTNCVRRGEQDACKTDDGYPPLSRPRASVAPSLPETITQRRAMTISSPAEEQPPIDPGLELQHSQPNGDAVMQDAASVLEFLAWGRRKDPDYHTVVSPETHMTSEPAPEGFDQCSQLSVVQLLLPSPRQVWQLVDWHEECLLWYHGSYFAPTFRFQLETFYSRHGGIVDDRGVNLQWVSLLFAVMAATLACAPPSKAHSWGFRDPEVGNLSRRWFQAIITCLNRADWTSNLSIFSCQAIATGTVPAHLLGFSNSQSIHLAAAVRVAQSLGLHRLGPDASGSMLEKETGRRVWCQLCSQDWFSIPFSESYLVNPLYSLSEAPSNCHDHDLTSLPSHIPTITSYCRFLREIASIMPQLQDGLMSCNTPFTRYEHVLTWDARLRTLAIRERPIFLTNAPLDPTWPSWVPWGRRALAISSSHKIIMIHRSFLSDSFTNPAFAFTRRTCLAASKTIIKEYKCVIEEDGPILWIHQAFSVAASIILLLDILHRDPGEAECREHQQLVEEVVGTLRSCRNSAIADRSVKLLGALLVEISVAMNGNAISNQARKRHRDGTSVSADSSRRITPRFNVGAFVRAFCADTERVQQPNQSVRLDEELATVEESPYISPPNQSNSAPIANSPTNYPVDFAQLDVNFAFPPAGLDTLNGFENLLYLANHDHVTRF